MRTTLLVTAAILLPAAAAAQQTTTQQTPNQTQTTTTESTTTTTPTDSATGEPVGPSATTTTTSTTTADSTAPSGPATAADVKKGVAIYDQSGASVGKVDSVSGKNAVVSTGNVKVSIPISSFAKSPKGLVVGMTKAEIEAAAKKKG